MRSILIACCVALVILSCGGLAWAQLPVSGLVGYYPFDGNANDESGNSNHALSVTAVLAPDRFGRPNSAYHFEGGTQIVLPNAFQYPTLTICAWFNQKQYGWDNTIFIQYANSQNWFKMYGDYRDDGVGAYLWLDGSYPHTWIVDQLNTVPLNRWNFVCLVINRANDRVSLYANGQLVDFESMNGHSLPDVGTVATTAIGGAVDVPSDYFVGEIDDVRLYDRALSEAEILSLFNEPSTVAPTIECPGSISASAPLDQCEATLTFGANATGIPTPIITYFINGNPVTLPRSFPVGKTEVECVASNSAGSARCTFTVTVLDQQVPTITCPANMEVRPQTLAGAKVDYATLIGEDNCAGVTTIQTAGLSSGSFFPIGTTTNSFRVTDAAGNSATCSFTVTVNDPMCGASKAYVCHKRQTLCVSVNAVDAHLAHGDLLGPCDLGKVVVEVPTDYTLSDNYPNPFNPTTTIEFGIPADSYVKLEVFNMLGEKVATLIDATRPAGYYSEQFNAANLASALYVYRLQAGDFVQTKKMMLTR